jgi:ribosome biogenesis GTPase A
VAKGLLDLNAPLIERYALKGVSKTIRAMIIGCPNTGKSTLINSLSPEKKAVTGNKPGVTKGKQWVTVAKYLELLDSPGVLYPDFSDKKKALNLALIGSIKDEILDINELALEGINLLKKTNAKQVKERYKIDNLEITAPEILEKIALSRGLLLKGGEADTEKASSAFISDLRKGYLGSLILD